MATHNTQVTLQLILNSIQRMTTEKKRKHEKTTMTVLISTLYKYMAINFDTMINFQSICIWFPLFLHILVDFLCVAVFCCWISCFRSLSAFIVQWYAVCVACSGAPTDSANSLCVCVCVDEYFHKRKISGQAHRYVSISYPTLFSLSLSCSFSFCPSLSLSYILVVLPLYAGVSERVFCWSQIYNTSQI